MPFVEAVTLESPHYGAIELTSHDFQSAVTLLIATAWSEGRCPRFAEALGQHVISQRTRGVALCHAIAQALVADQPAFRHFWSRRRGACDHSWVELGDETLDAIWTLNDEPVLNVMRRDVFRHEHRVVRPRRWTDQCVIEPVE